MIPFDDSPHSGDFYISTDQRLLDYEWLEKNLLTKAWAETWTMERLTCVLEFSLCFGIYKQPVVEAGLVQTKHTMVGFARVITDRFTYSMVADVVIDPEFENRGLGKFLIGTIINHSAVRGTVSVLRTSNDKARHIYEKFGYVEVPAMRRIPLK